MNIHIDTTHRWVKKRVTVVDLTMCDDEDEADAFCSTLKEEEGEEAEKEEEGEKKDEEEDEETEKVQLPSLASFETNQNEGVDMQTSEEEAVEEEKEEEEEEAAEGEGRRRVETGEMAVGGRWGEGGGGQMGSLTKMFGLRV